MALSIQPALENDDPRLDPLVRGFVLPVLMVVEILFFTIRFEQPKDSWKIDLWWTYPLFHGRSIIELSLLMTATVAAFGGLRLAFRLRRALFVDFDAGYRWDRWFLAHGVSLAAMAGLTAAVCEGEVWTSSNPGLWMVAWLASVVATVGTWLLTLISASGWLEILKRSYRTLLAGAAIAVLAFVFGGYTNTLWGTMAGATLILAQAILSLVSSQVISRPAERMIGIDGFQVFIADPCSGYEGIGLVVAFLAGYCWFFRNSLRWPHAYFLIPVGAVLSWLLNAFRIASLVIIGSRFSPSVALGGFHSQAGSLAFLAVSLGLVALSRRSRFFVADHEKREVSGSSNHSLAFLGPFLVVLATSLVTASMSSGFDLFYGLRVLTGGLALWYFRRQFAGMILNASWVGVVVGVLAFGLWVALEPASTGAGRALASTVGAMPGGRAWAWIALRVIGSVAIIPVVEELAFRGYLLRRLVSVEFDSVSLARLAWLPLLVSSAAFGLLHGRWLAGMLVGVMYGLAVYRRGKLGDAIVAHAVTNGLIAATVLVTGDWSMWT